SESAGRILAQFPGPVILRQKEDKQVYFLLAGPSFIGLGAVFLWVVSDSPQALSYLLAISFMILGAYMTVGIIFALVTGGMWMKLDVNGFEFRFWTKHQSRRWPWNTVKDFAVTSAGFKSFVSFEDGSRPEWWQLNRILYFVGRQRLPESYGLGQEN